MTYPKATHVLVTISFCEVLFGRRKVGSTSISQLFLHVEALQPIPLRLTQNAVNYT